jgi:serine phosphatase RsbU (regulator of sigma subunit)
MLRILFLSSLLLFSYFGSNAQESISELEKKLNSAKGHEKYTILYELCKAYLQVSPKKSIEYGKKAIDEAKKLKDNSLIADANNLIGTAYYNQQNYRLALKHYEDELAIRKNLGQQSSSIKNVLNIGAIYEAWGKPLKAVEYYLLAVQEAEKEKSKSIMLHAYESIIRLYVSEKKYKEAFDFQLKYMEAKAIRTPADDEQKIAILETKYLEVKKAKEQTEAILKQTDSTLNVVQVEKEILETDTTQKGQAITSLTIETTEQKAKVKRQRQWILAFGLFFGIISVFSILLYKEYRAKKRAHEKLLIQNAEILEQKEEIQAQAERLLEMNSEIEEQKEEIETQADELALRNKELVLQRDKIVYQKMQITDSIEYASRIQKVMLPSDGILDSLFREWMVLWKPLDIVSGDFYWAKQLKNFIVFTAADCTGHGVPGAFMSMLGISFLNEIVSKTRFDKSNEILELMRKRVKNSLNQTGKENESMDGMDMALCILDTENNVLQYSGANNPLYIFRDNELLIYKADRQPIAIYPNEHPFTCHEIQLKRDDVLYIFSDGYIDQFGGKNSERLKIGRFKALLQDIYHRPLSEQKVALNDFLEKWKGKENSQIDDILIFAIRI